MAAELRDDWGVVNETRTAHCKVYTEPTLKRQIQNYANRNGMTFSEAGRELWIQALTILNRTKELNLSLNTQAKT